MRIEISQRENRKGNLIWPEWAIAALAKLVYHDQSWPGAVRMLDALAEAQEMAVESGDGG